MTAFHQSPLPPTWHLADQAILPGGRTLTGTAARVYNLLLETNRRAHRWPVGRHLAPTGWVPTWVLREPWAGGAAGDRRLRDLREAGITIESQRFDPGDTEPASASWLWHLTPGSASPSPARGECVWEKGPGDEGPRVDLPSPGEGARRVGRGAGGEGPGGAGSLPLGGVAVRFTADRDPAGALDVSPGAATPLAPSFAACDDEAYRRELLQTFHSGLLVALLKERAEWRLWADPAALYDPRPVLRGALSKLGATLGH